jgi:hypothetical protein
LDESAVDTDHSRFCYVLEYMDSHLDDDLTIYHLNNIVTFSLLAKQLVMMPRYSAAGCRQRYVAKISIYFLP